MKRFFEPTRRDEEKDAIRALNEKIQAKFKNVQESLRKKLIEAGCDPELVDRELKAANVKAQAKFFIDLREEAKSMAQKRSQSSKPNQKSY